MSNLVHLLRHLNWAIISMFIGAMWVLLLRIYYHAKPSLPGWMRLALRRWLAKRQRKSCGDTWPILESAGFHRPIGAAGPINASSLSC